MMEEKRAFHTLETQRLRFKKMTLSDGNAIHEYASNPDVSRFIGWPLMHSYGETMAFVQEMMNKEEAGTHIYANVIENDSDKVIGTVMLFNFDKVANKAEIGYVFHQDIWGKGYCTEAATIVCKYAFEVLGLHKIHAQVTAVNVGSSRVLEKNGFEKEGHLKDHYYIDDRYYDCLLYGKFQK